MARVNDPPSVSADSLETLRRKFLRQNRDIARVNSNQSLRIRSLENECARLLSDNLELRGHVLRLEKEVENNSASRIADHALEIKARMEMQLLEMSSLLECLGHEPPMKRRSPNREERRIAKPRLSLGQSPPQRRRRLTGEEQDALAAQEGRLPPIHEHKSYPRQTLGSEEILALCSEAETSTDSPIGPPPVSIFAEEDIDRTVSPTKARRLLVYTDVADPEKTSPATHNDRSPTEQTTPSPSKQTLPTQQTRTEPSCSLQTTEKTPATLPDENTVRHGSKRKHAITDENEIPNFAKTLATVKSTTETPAALRDIKPRRNVKALTGSRRDVRDTKSSVAGANPPRLALAVKSRNEDMSSPRKTIVKGPAAADSKPTLKETQPKSAVTDVLLKVILEMPKSPSPPSLAEITLSEPPAPSLADHPPSPGTPGHIIKREESCDTPPPKDISSAGDTARASRRSRTAVSYAEPNLRDKMRRPTKELTDAVSGEGKYKHRTSINHIKGEETTVPKSATKERVIEITPDASHSIAAQQGTPKPAERSPSDESGRESVATTPASQQGPSPPPNGDLTAGNITSRRKRMLSNDADSVPERTAASEFVAKTATESLPVKEAHKPAAAPTPSASDPYEFITTSPAVAERPASQRSGHGRSSRRQPHSSVGEGELTVHHKASSRSSAAARKRASLAVARKAPLTHRGADDSDDEYAAESEGADARDRLSRRRSMML